MADMATLENALRKADALARQGDQRAASDAKAIADAIREQRALPAEGPPEGMTLDPISGQYRDREMRGRANPQSNLQGVARSFVQGYAYGGGDEAMAAVASAGKGGTYDSRLEDERAMLDQFRDEHPVMAYGSEIAGALSSPGGALFKGAKTLGGKVAQAAGSAGILGSIYGYLAGEGGVEERAKSAAVTGATSAVTGGAVPLVVRGAEKLVNNRATGKALTKVAAEGTDQLRADQAALRASAKARGVSVTDTAAARLVGDVEQLAQDFGAHGQITPGAMAAISEVQKFAQPAPNGLRTVVDWTAIETARKVAANAGRAAKPGSPDRLLAGQIADKIDDFVANLVDGDLASAPGSAAGLGDDLKLARNIWSRVKNSERLETAIEDAHDAASGFDNGLKVEFRKLIKDKKFFNALSKEEKAAVRHVVRGTNTGIALRITAGLSPGLGLRRNMTGATIGSMGGAAVGSAIAGPPGAVIGAMAPVAIGHMAERGSEAITSGLATKAQGLMSSGGLPLIVPARYPGIENAMLRGAEIARPVASNLWNR